MIKPIVFGQGKHCVEFLCRENRELRIIEYRAHTLQGITKILKRFRRSLKKFDENIRLYSLEQAIKDAMPYGYRWLAANCERCRLYLNGENGSLIFYNVTNHN